MLKQLKVLQYKFINFFNKYQLFKYIQMNKINKGFQKGVDISEYADHKFDDMQMAQIREGLESGVDVTKYANPKFDNMQMAQIREGLENEVDVTEYANYKFSVEQMKEIKSTMKDGYNQSQIIQSALDENLDMEI